MRVLAGSKINPGSKQFNDFVHATTWRGTDTVTDTEAGVGAETGIFRILEIRGRNNLFH
jgi:hypothetical protein